MIDPEMELLRELRRKWHLWACTEVNSYYGCIADILAVDPRKKSI